MISGEPCSRVSPREQGSCRTSLCGPRCTVELIGSPCSVGPGPVGAQPPKVKLASGPPSSEFSLQRRVRVAASLGISSFQFRIAARIVVL